MDGRRRPELKNLRVCCYKNLVFLFRSAASDEVRIGIMMTNLRPELTSEEELEGEEEG